MYDPLVFWEENAQHWIDLKQPTAQQWKWIKPHVSPDWKVLELGCGTGRWSQYFQDYTGVDISPSLVVHAQNKYPNKTFLHHDQRYPIPEGFDLIFTFTSWLHVTPDEIAKVKLPDTNYLFIEPNEPGRNEYCFTHDLEKIFGVHPVAKHAKLTVYIRRKEETNEAAS